MYLSGKFPCLLVVQSSVRIPVPTSPHYPREYALNETSCRIGRNDAWDIVIPITVVSRRDPIIVTASGQHCIIHTSGKNPLFVNNRKIMPGREYGLQNLDHIAIRQGPPQLIFFDRAPSDEVLYQLWKAFDLDEISLTTETVPIREQAIHLTPGEWRVLHTLASADDDSDRAIAAALSLSSETVKGYLRSLYSKFGVQKRTRLLREAMRLGFIPYP